MATMADTSRPVLSLKRKSDGQNTSRPVLTIKRRPASTAQPKPAKPTQADNARTKEPPAEPVKAKKAKEPKEPVPPIPPLVGPRLPNAKMRQFLSMYKLLDNWPHIFDAKKPQPLAIGIHIAILEDAERKGVEISENEIRLGIYFYTRKEAYLKSIINGDRRIDIDGSEADEITEHQKEVAQNILYKKIIVPHMNKWKSKKSKPAE